MTIDGFAIAVSTEGGPLMLGTRTSAEDSTPVAALLDTLTPVTVVDSLAPDPAAPADTRPPEPTRYRATLELLSDCPGTDVVGCEPIARAQFRGKPIIDVHPCQDVRTTCGVGVGTDIREYAAVVGGDILSESAVRLDLRDSSAPSLQLFPDIAGTDREHCSAGETVIPVDLSGGGTMFLQGGEVFYGATRIPLETCLGPTVDDLTIRSGSDALLLLATGLGFSVLSHTAYARYAATDDSIAPLEQLPQATIQLVSGTTSARIATISSVGVAGQGNGKRGPCEEWRASVVMRTTDGCTAEQDCPCSTGLRCTAAASFTTTPDEPLTFAVIPDEHPLLQALRAELRPGQAEVDGLLGMNGLAAIRLDIDYPGERLLVVCADGDARCAARPKVGNATATDAAQMCEVIN